MEMEYEQFRIEYTKRCMDLLNAQDHPERVKLRLAGYRGADENEAEEVRATNRRTFHSDAEELQGDMLSIQVRTHSDGISDYVGISVQDAYEQYKIDEWATLDDKLKDAVGKLSHLDSSVLTKASDYQAVKDKLIVTLRNVPRSKLNLQTCLCQRMDDFAIVLYLVSGNTGDGGRLISPVTKDTATKWGIPEDEIFQHALENTARLTPVRVGRSKAYMRTGRLTEEIPLNSDADVEPAKRELGRADDLILLATPSTDGAIAFFFPGMMDRIAALLGGDYLVAPISTDFMLFHRPGTIRPEVIRSFLRKTANEDDALSQNVYYYNHSKRRLVKR